VTLVVVTVATPDELSRGAALACSEALPISRPPINAAATSTRTISSTGPAG
jgi:hypothetical protein